MKRAHQTIQTAANVAIILVVLLLAGVLVTRFLLPASTPPPVAGAENEGVKVGTKVQLADIAWSGSNKTLIMVLSTTCRFCTASMPFYQKLIQQKQGGEDLRIIAVLPQRVEEAKEYLGKHGISVDGVRQDTLDELNVSGTPTLIEVDETGSVVRSWVGKLPPEKEAEVLKSVFGPSSGT
jgi:thioredoxin-related protein